MREILFRGKTYDGEWVEGSLHIEYGETSKDGKSKTDYRILGMRGECRYIIPETVGQYTGLTDKNGKKIFEGDIVNCITSDFDGSDKFVYNFKVADIADFETMGFLDFCNEIEIIGNIHDNPELLKEGADNE